MLKLIPVLLLFVHCSKSHEPVSPVDLMLNETSELYTYLLNEFGLPLPPVYPPVDKFETYYDFIVIGAGSAGSVVANRLSEVPQWKVLLLEAGDQAPIASEIPAAAMLLTGTKNDWFYEIERQVNAGFNFRNHRMRWPSGRTLGGGSTINYMGALRGHPDDYNTWARQGNPGWAWKDVFPYFLKSEDFLVDHGDFGYHKRGGLLTIEKAKTPSIAAEVFLQASLENGEQFVDYNGRESNGVSYFQGTLRNGRRCSTEKAFLRPAKNRKNLTIVPKAYVTRILIDSSRKAARGVEVAYNDTVFSIYARKEVIVSAGTVRSPHLLMLSGIGPKDDLQKFGIPVVKDLPVGRKMYDHSMFLGLIFTANRTIIPEFSTQLTEKNLLDLVLYGDGQLVRFGTVGEGFLFHNFTIKSPEIEIVTIAFSTNRDLLQHYLGVSDPTYDALVAPIADQPIFQISPLILHPKSFGQIKLKSNNPYDAPRIFSNSNTNAADDDILLKAVRYIQRLIKMPSFARFNIKLHEAIQPGCENYDYNTDDYWRCCVRGFSRTGLHPLGTCRMGPTRDKDAVVDRELKVYGISGLRVIDNSVIPVTISGHTNLPAIMVGEKGADLVKNKYGIHF